MEIEDEEYINILQIGDLHFDGEIKYNKSTKEYIPKKNETAILYNNFLKGIKKEKIDIIVFVGDFFTNTVIHDNKKIEEVTKEIKCFIENIKKTLNCHNIVYCAGNHDFTNRGLPPDYAKKKYKYTNPIQDTEDIKKTLIHYNKIFADNINNYEIDNKNIDYVKKIKIKNKSIIFYSFYTSGLHGCGNYSKITTKENVNLYRRLVVDNSLLNTNNISGDVIIAVLHHSLDFLHLDDRYLPNNISDFIHNKVDIVFSGHTHPPKQSLNTFLNNDNFCFANIVSGAFHFNNDRIKNSFFNIVKINLIEDNEVKIKPFYFTRKHNITEDFRTVYINKNIVFNRKKEFVDSSFNKINKGEWTKKEKTKKIARLSITPDGNENTNYKLKRAKKYYNFENFDYFETENEIILNLNTLEFIYSTTDNISIPENLRILLFHLYEEDSNTKIYKSNKIISFFDYYIEENTLSKKTNIEVRYLYDKITNIEVLFGKSKLKYKLYILK